MVDYERVRSVRLSVHGGLMLLPGVHATGIGLKRINGERTDELSIVVFCVKKRPLSELTPEEVVPAQINGVKTDIIEMAVPTLHVDHDTSRPRPMLGGVTIQPKGANEFGTLGCFAMTQDPQPKVVAVTCQHVVAPPTGSKPTDVNANLIGSASPFKISFSITGPNAAGSFIVVKIGNQLFTKSFSAYWTVTAADTPATIAANVMAAINAMTGSGASASAGQLPEEIIVTITAPGLVVRQVSVYDPLVPDKDVKLLAAVTGNAITLTGKVDGDYCAYVSWNVNGPEPTRGAFTALPGNTPAASVPGLIVASITALGVPGITATATGPTVTIDGAAQASCIITRDMRVGQPTDSFSSNCSLCCSDEMGRVIAANQELDTALVQVRRKIQYLNEVKGDVSVPGDPCHSVTIDNTVVKGVRDVSANDLKHLLVHKHGATTGYTTGTVDALDTHGYGTNTGNVGQNNQWTVFGRYYSNAIVVLGPTGCPFNDRGDSGAAVLDSSGNVVGILFGGENRGLVTPIGLITSALKITIATATAPNQVQTVTDAQGTPAAVPAAGNETLRQVLTTQAEIAATPAGRRYTELIGRHSGEVQDLVNTNLRVAVAWHRNSGPEIVRAALRYIENPQERLPQEIDGVPLTERLTKIRDALVRYGSAELTDDLARYGGELLALTSLSYSEALEQMRASEPAAADAG